MKTLCKLCLKCDQTLFQEDAIKVPGILSEECVAPIKS